MRDVLEIDENVLVASYGTPDFIWFSPPCQGFSVASIGRNWNLVSGIPIPKSKTAQMGLQLLTKCFYIVSCFPKAKWAIENPRGMMRKVITWHVPRTVTYCQYGEYRMKPTDIWTNLKTWDPRPACKNGDPCHVRAPRGSRTGTQGYGTVYDRAALPLELCREVAEAVDEENGDTA